MGYWNQFQSMKSVNFDQFAIDIFLHEIDFLVYKLLILEKGEGKFIHPRLLFTSDRDLRKNVFNTCFVGKSMENSV